MKQLLTLRVMSLALVALYLAAFSNVSYAATFSDVPETHPNYEAITLLSNLGVIGGYSDGTFRPDELVTRAAAAKILASSLLPATYIDAMSPSTTFTDIPANEWYLKYVEALRQSGAISGPPVYTFRGESSVTLAEFLKILLVLQRYNSNQYATEYKEVASDVTDFDSWYYPYMVHGIATTMIDVDTNGNLYPAKNLTRAETAQLLNNFIQFKGGKVVDQAETKIKKNLQQVSSHLDAERLASANQASFRAIALANSLQERLHSTRSEAIQQITWAVGKSLLNQNNEAKRLLRDADKLDAATYAEYEPIIPPIINR